MAITEPAVECKKRDQVLSINYRLYDMQCYQTCLLKMAICS